MRDEVLLCCDISREIPPSLLSLKGSLTLWMQPKNFLDIAVSTRDEHRESPHDLRRSPFFLPVEMRVHFRASSGKESRPSCHTARGDCLNLNVERNARRHATIQKDPNCWEPAQEIPPWTRACGETGQSKASQVSRGPLAENYLEIKICLFTVCYTVTF